MRRTLLLLTTGLMLAACVNVGPGTTAPPIVVPSVPPINLPSIPPINLPSLPPFDIPSGLLPGGTGKCDFITPQEVGAIFGTTPTVIDDSSGACTFSMGIPTVVVSIESGTDLASSKLFLGNTAKDVTVGGLPAVTGVFIGQPTVHVQRGSDQLQVLGVLTGSDDATIAKLVQVANIAVTRWP
jgi:hypothetical protein